MKEFPCVEWTLMLSICDPSLFLDYTDSLYVCENWGGQIAAMRQMMMMRMMKYGDASV